MPLNSQNSMQNNQEDAEKQSKLTKRDFLNEFLIDFSKNYFS
jgi:hypothetical protein